MKHILFYMSFLMTFSAQAKVLKESKKILSSQLQQKKFAQEGSKCGLKSFTLLSLNTEYKNLSGTKGTNRFAQIAAAVETSSLKCLKDFVVVQYIRGCTYETNLFQSGEVTQNFGTTRELRGKMVTFRHPEWIVDSADVDPMYGSNDGETNSRMDYLRFPKTPFKFENSPVAIEREINKAFSKYIFLQDKAPTKPLYYVTDMPSSASYRRIEKMGVMPARENAQHVSFDFKICVYRTSDVPLINDPLPPDFSKDQGGPIECFDWSHNEIFNYATKKFETKKEIAPACL